MAIYDQDLEYRKLNANKNAEILGALQAFGNFINQRKELEQNAPYKNAMAQQAMADARIKQAQMQAYMNPQAPPSGGIQKTQKDIFGNQYITKEYMDYLDSYNKHKQNNQFNRQKELIDYRRSNPTLDQDTKGAVAAYNYSLPRLSRIKTAIEQLDNSTFKNLFKQVQVGANNDLIVPDGSPIEDLVGAINDIRLTGFGLGGKNFTENEAKIVFGRLNPIGKSKERWIKDINSLPDFFKEKIGVGLGGAEFAKQSTSVENPLTQSDSLSNQAAQILAKRRSKK